MAIYYARKSGNVNATDVWATTPTGTAGDFFPLFTSSDTLMANGFSITINVNLTVLEIRNDTANGASVGGGFGIVSSGITLTANVVGGPSVNGTTLSISTAGSSSIANIIGNIIGGSAFGTVSINFSSPGTLNITGTIVGGVSGNSGNNASAIANIGIGTINITGSVTGGSGSAGVLNIIGGLGVVNIIGVATGGSVAPGATNAGGGLLTVIRAKGNGFGNGSVGLNSVVGVAGNQTSLTRVYEIEYGDLGQSPTSGPVFLFPASSNVALFYRSGTTKKTLVDAASSSGLLPNASDVRSGITYNAGTNIGTMAVPGAASVASGVAVDNTTGTAILTTGNIADIWNYPVSGISVSNSIGERLKNCSTVATMGQQLAAALNNVQ